jgi:hypothetical protein
MVVEIGAIPTTCGVTKNAQTLKHIVGASRYQGPADFLVNKHVNQGHQNGVGIRPFHEFAKNHEIFKVEYVHPRSPAKILEAAIAEVGPARYNAIAMVGENCETIASRIATGKPYSSQGIRFVAPLIASAAMSFTYLMHRLANIARRKYKQYKHYYAGGNNIITGPRGGKYIRKPNGTRMYVK